MTRATRTGICVLGLTAALGCDRRSAADSELTRQSEQSADPVMVSGCLTSHGDRFVLTQLDQDNAPVASTEMYQLTGADDDLRRHVGHVVQVFGEAPPPEIAELRQGEPGAAGTAGQGQAAGGAADPQVTTSQTTRFETRTLRVASVIPTEQSCVSSAPGETEGR